MPLSLHDRCGDPQPARKRCRLGQGVQVWLACGVSAGHSRRPGCKRRCPPRARRMEIGHPVTYTSHNMPTQKGDMEFRNSHYFDTCITDYSVMRAGILPYGCGTMRRFHTARFCGRQWTTYILRGTSYRDLDCASSCTYGYTVFCEIISVLVQR